MEEQSRKHKQEMKEKKEKENDKRKNELDIARDFGVRADTYWYDV